MKIGRLMMYLGPVIFVVVGTGFVIAAALVPEGALTDDGHPLDSFFLVMGGIFGPIGALWGVGAYFGLRYHDKQIAEREVRREWLRRHGRHVQARVVSCETTGYVNFENESYTDLVIEYDEPGGGRRRIERTMPLPQAVLQQLKAGAPLAILIDPMAPHDYLLA